MVSQLQQSCILIQALLKHSKTSDSVFAEFYLLSLLPSIHTNLFADRNEFVENDEHFVDPRVPVRLPQNIQYPGRDNYLAQAIREGLLERKSKYLKRFVQSYPYID